MKLLSNGDLLDTYLVRESIMFDCEWTQDFRAQYGDTVRDVLAAATLLPRERVVLRSVRPGMTIDYLVEPNPATEERAKETANRLAIMLRSGQVTQDLLTTGFPACGSSMT